MIIFSGTFSFFYEYSLMIFTFYNYQEDFNEKNMFYSIFLMIPFWIVSAQIILFNRFLEY